MSELTRPVGRWRKAAAYAQGLAALGLPFAQINGRPALRFDIPTLSLYAFGVRIAVNEFFIVLAGVMAATFAFLSVTVFLGRVWCGWACPQTVLSDLTMFIERKAGPAGRVARYAAVAIVAAVVSADMLWYFVSPYEFISRAGQGTLGPVLGGSWLVLTLIIFINLAFIRRVFCATVCPYSKLQSVIFDRDTLVVAYDKTRSAECMGCDACRRACPVKIDIREGLKPACIHCALCRDACAGRMGRKGKPSLIRYMFGGTPDGVMRPARASVVLTAAASIVFLAVMLFMLGHREALDVTVGANPAFPPRLSVKGEAVNSYIVTLRSRDGRERGVGIAVPGALSVEPVGPYHLTPDATTRVVLYVTRPAGARDAITDAITIVVEEPGGEARAERTVRFISPRAQ